VRCHGLFLVFCCAIGTGCGGTTVDLGVPRPPPYLFGSPRLLAELDIAYANQNPTLTADLLDLYFTSNRGADGADVWAAHRAASSDPFDPPAVVAEVSSPMYETSPAIALDGLSVYFGSDRDGGLGDLDIWSATRADRAAPWSSVANLSALNSAAKDIPRPPGQHGLVMPMSSERDSVGSYRTFLSARPSADQPFGVPALISGLTGADASLTDAYLSDDGLTLFYAVAPPGGTPDLYVAWRASTADRFSLPTALTDLNSTADERDPWLSPDGTVFFFTSDRTGSLQIYEASARRQTP
jgi:WD40-like Beta Propeller Repeat